MFLLQFFFLILCIHMILCSCLIYPIYHAVCFLSVLCRHFRGLFADLAVEEKFRSFLTLLCVPGFLIPLILFFSIINKFSWKFLLSTSIYSFSEPVCFKDCNFKPSILFIWYAFDMHFSNTLIIHINETHCDMSIPTFRLCRRSSGVRSCPAPARLALYLK